MIKGIHHITAIASDPQKTYDFYTKTLGLRLVKKSVNQDDLSTYHLFFGDRYGHPGMDLTFFTFQPSFQGENGNGLVTKISLAIPKSALNFWKKRFEENGVDHKDIKNNRLQFFDGDRQSLELVGVDEIEESEDTWTTREVSKEFAIRYFYSATLTVEDIELVRPVLIDAFGYEEIETKENYYLYKINGTERAAYLEVEVNSNGEYGVNGAGTVHHIAFQVKDEKEEVELAKRLIRLGLRPTPIIDRFYFKSVYFRTHAGILFELATEGPGFTADEKESELGKELALPPFLESQRDSIEKGLTPIND